MIEDPWIKKVGYGVCRGRREIVKDMGYCREVGEMRIKGYGKGGDDREGRGEGVMFVGVVVDIRGEEVSYKV